MTKLAVDMSNWGGDLTDVEAQCFLANGYVLAIPGTQDAAQYQQQVATAVRNGLRVQAYVYLNWGRALQQVQRAISLMSKDVEILWLDVEDDTSGLSPAGIVVVLQQCVRACDIANILCGIYASRNTWTTLTGDYQGMNDLPLWNAYYDNDPDIDFASNPYGGWTAPLIEQFGNTQDVCGQSVDVNVINEELDDMPTKEEFQQLAAYVVRVDNKLSELANGQNVVIDHNDVQDGTPKITLKGLWFIAGKAWPF